MSEGGRWEGARDEIGGKRVGGGGGRVNDGGPKCGVSRAALLQKHGGGERTGEEEVK